MTSRVASLLSLLVVVVSGACPPLTPGEWERNERSRVLFDYDKYNLRCPSVNIALFPERILLERDISRANLDVGILLDWRDPGLAADVDQTVRMNGSEIWTPQLLSSGLDSLLLTPPSVTALSLAANLKTGAVSSFYRTTMRGMCYPHSRASWPHDGVFCHFLVSPLRTGEFNLTQHASIAQLDVLRKKFGKDKAVQRMTSWRLEDLDSESYTSGHVVVTAMLQRLPAQLEAEVVHPMCLVSALVPASVALPPWSGGRPVLVATAFLLHAMLLLYLPYLGVEVDGDTLPRNLLLYRDAGFLMLVVVLQWLLSLRLASRKKPLAGWLRAVARALAPLRTPLLLPTVPTMPEARPQHTRRPLDGESVGLSEVLDRLTFLTVAAGYLAIVVVSLQ